MLTRAHYNIMQRQDYEILEEEIIVILRNAERPLLCGEMMRELEKKDFRFPLVHNTVDIILSSLAYRGHIESSMTSFDDLLKPIYYTVEK